ncbi:hypothetical protein [Streptomyces sp. NPDC127038]|uniref:hypothetical protein n=1 Tax=Streptomyces sp. NPDC127038 TaxID=3347114 RepID=UPI0036474FBB
MTASDPLHTALTRTLAAHGITNPVLAAALTDTAVRILGRDRCTHHWDTHDQHHPTTVTDCPWCAARDERPAP